MLWGLERLLLRLAECLVLIIKYVLPGLKGLSQKLPTSPSQTCGSAPSLSWSLKSDLVLYETMVSLYNNNLSNFAEENYES